MPTPHISAENGQFAKTVLMPGDPLRAKFVAENFLEDAKLVTSVRNVLGYTGRYKGKEVSVMASGMGMPSIGIYSYELYNFYGVEDIIRIGSAGAIVPDLKLFDVVLAEAAFSESSYAKVFCGEEGDTAYPSAELNREIMAAAGRAGVAVSERPICSGDVFYDALGKPLEYYAARGCCKEMESFALFTNAKVLGKRAACLLTISDSLVTREETTSQQRESAFTDMMRVALEAVR